MLECFTGYRCTDPAAALDAVKVYSTAAKRGFSVLKRLGSGHRLAPPHCGTGRTPGIAKCRRWITHCRPDRNSTAAI